MFHETNTNERLKNIMLTERSKSKNHQNRTLPHKNELKKIKKNNNQSAFYKLQTTQLLIEQPPLAKKIFNQ